MIDAVLANETPTYFIGECSQVSDLYDPIETSAFCEAYAADCLECDGDENTTCIGSSCEDCVEVESWFGPMDLGEPDTFCTTYTDYAVDCDLDGQAECCLACDGFCDYEF